MSFVQLQLELTVEWITAGYVQRAENSNYQLKTKITPKRQNLVVIFL